VKFFVEIDLRMSIYFVRKLVSKKTITNRVTVGNFQIITDRFNVHRSCAQPFMTRNNVSKIMTKNVPLSQRSTHHTSCRGVQKVV
jgi:hypothetical protein